MANTALSGLFGGSSELDVLDLMRREQEAKSVQARAFPTSTASIAAAAQQEGKNALKKMFGGVAGGLGLDVAVDPRLAKARKRETDKREIMGILQEYATDGFSQDEVKKGWSLLTSRGYLKEAEEFRKMYKEISDADDSESGNGGLKSSQILDAFIDKDSGVRYRTVLYNYKNGTNRKFILDDTGREVDRSTIKGTKIPVDRKGMSSTGRVFEHIEKHAADLTVKERGEWNKEKFTEIAKAPTYAQNMNQADRLLGLLEKINTSGLQANIQEVTDFFDLTPADVTEFDSETRRYVTTQLQMMGRNPTDFDLKFLLKVNPGMLKSKQGNIRLLTLLKAHNQRKYDLARELNAGEYSRSKWYKRILVPSEQRLEKWHKRQKKLFGISTEANPDSAKVKQKRFKVVSDGQGGFKSVLDE